MAAAVQHGVMISAPIENGRIARLQLQCCKCHNMRCQVVKGQEACFPQTILEETNFVIVGVDISFFLVPAEDGKKGCSLFLVIENQVKFMKRRSIC